MTTAKTPGIITRNLHCGYDGRAVLTDVNLDLPHGGVSCILGKSGCGKSTLLRTLLLLEPPISGEILFDGEPVRTSDPKKLETLRKSLGVLFQGAALFNSLTLLENAAFPILEGTRIPESVALDLAILKLDLVGLSRFAHYLPSAVSGGMRKRCGIARALALDPRHLFLDEPSAGLDPVTAAEIDRLILDLRDQLGTTIVVVTHELSSIDAIADHIVMLDRGAVLAAGDKKTVRSSADPVVRDFFDRRLPAPPPAQSSGGLADRLLPEPRATG